MSFISKQPNGLYCRFSTIVDCPTNWNMTFDDYVEVIRERGYDLDYAKKEAKDVIENYLKPFEEVIDCFLPNNMTTKEFKEWLELVGYKDQDNI